MEAWWCTWIPIIVVFWILYMQKKKRKKAVMSKFIQKNEGISIMRELAQRFIGKDCYINLLDGTVDGTLSEVTDGGLVVIKDGKQQLVNLNYVMKIREYPYNKKGKRASVFGE